MLGQALSQNDRLDADIFDHRLLVGADLFQRRRGRVGMDRQAGAWGVTPAGAIDAAAKWQTPPAPHWIPPFAQKMRPNLQFKTPRTARHFHGVATMKKN